MHLFHFWFTDQKYQILNGYCEPGTEFVMSLSTTTTLLNACNQKSRTKSSNWLRIGFCVLCLFILTSQNEWKHSSPTKSSMTIYMLLQYIYHFIFSFLLHFFFWETNEDEHRHYTKTMMMVVFFFVSLFQFFTSTHFTDFQKNIF